MRTIIDLPDEQVGALAEHCRTMGISRAEAVRRAVRSMLESQRLPDRERAFGAWRQKGLDSRAFVEELRKEWEDEE